MPRRGIAFTTALALSLSALAPASASEARRPETARPDFVVPTVISVAYRNPRIATQAGEAARQGGFAVAGATRWPGAPEPAPAAAFTAPAVICVAYRDPRIATQAGEVRRQGGFATAGQVRWLAGAAPFVAELKPAPLTLGAL